MNACISRLLTLALLSGLLVLGGCASTPPPISSVQKLTGQEGAVVFRLISNGSSDADPADTLSSITLERELPPGVKPSSEDTAILRRTREMTQSTAIFSGMVAPGRYRMTQANGFFANITYTFPLQGRLSTFEVKPGQVALLGTLLVQPLADRGFVIGYLAPDAELTRSFETLFPALAAQTRGQAPTTFEPSAALQKSALLAPAFRLMTRAQNNLHMAPDGSWLAGSRMGRVMWRKPGTTTWRSLQIDTWHEVLNVRPYRGGLLAAGEEGLLRFSADEGKSWQALNPPAPGLMAAAEPLANGKLLVLVRRDAVWSAHLSDDPFTGGWRELARFEQQNSLNVPWQKPIVLSGNNRVGVLMANGEYRVVDGSSEKLEQHATGVSTFSAELLPDGMLVVGGGTMTRSTLVSRDGGKSWTDLNTTRFLTAIAFADPSTAYAVAPLNPGVFAGDYSLLRTQDGGKTWAVSGTVPGGVPHQVRRLVVDRSDGALWAFLSSGRSLRSTDGGKTWDRGL
jgi:photosystem II stability/assembly factor-like uncharacterized protein